MKVLDKTMPSLLSVENLCSAEVLEGIQSGVEEKKEAMTMYTTGLSAISQHC